MLQPIASDLAGSTAWTATDQILDRAVRVTILTDGHVPQALDAARRAALVSDPRLVRVLDVGEHDGVAYLITEPVLGPSLAQLVAHGPLPAAQARAIIGEAAAALETARRRGVHHLALRPSVVHLTPDDGVVITGLAVDGALLGAGLGDARSTTRADTVGLVALLYAALTGKWPGSTLGTDTDSGPLAAHLPPAPVLNGGPVPPTELVAGVPNDLDTLCAVTLGTHDDGPRSPAELVVELAPWADIRAADLLGRSTPESGATALISPVPRASATPAPEPIAPPTVQRTSVRSAFAGKPAGAADRPGTPPPAVPVPTGSFGTEPVSAPPAPAPIPAHEPVPAPAPPRAPARVPVLAPAGEPVREARTAPPTAAPAPARAVGRTPAAADRDAAAEPDAVPLLPRAFGELAIAREVMTTKRFDPTRLVLAVVAVLMLIGFFLAFNALTAPTAPAPRGTDVAAEPSPSASAPQEPQESAPATPAAPPPETTPTIASGQQLDPPPQGDDNEHPEAVPLAIDGDPATAWFTRTYRSPDFAGLKDGVGYAVNLAASATVSTVTLQVNGAGGRVEVRATDPSTPTAGPVLAEGTLGASTVLTLSAPTTAEHLVLWFTALPQTADGSNRLELAEVTLG